MVQFNSSKSHPKIFIQYQGKSLPAKEWSEITGIHKDTIQYRLRHGWTVEQALTIPPLPQTGLTEKYPGEYQSWTAARNRCYKQSDPAWNDYGRRGIEMCIEWRDNFPQFIKDMGPHPSPEEYTLDRKDNDKGYCPNNCRWATPKTQGRNRRNNKLLTFQGETHCVSEWAEKLELSDSAIYDRINKGWTDDDILTVKSYKGRHWRSKLLTFNGVTKTATEWAKETGIPKNAIIIRIRKNWPVELILTVPPNRGNNIIRLMEQLRNTNSSTGPCQSSP